MVSIRALAPLSGSIEGDKGIRLSNGGAVALSGFNICLKEKPPQPVLDTIVARGAVGDLPRPATCRSAR